jgi:hypothetical protein
MDKRDYLMLIFFINVATALVIISNSIITKRQTAIIIEEIRFSNAKQEQTKACIDSLLERGHFIYWGDERECK